MKKHGRFKRKLSVFAGLAMIIGVFWFYHKGNEDLASHTEEAQEKLLEFRQKIKEPLTPYLLHSQWVPEIEVNTEDGIEKYKLEYTLNPDLQKEAEKLLKAYKPDYGAIVTMDASTGRILTLASYHKGDESAPNLAFRGTFPAASIFKIVTATAALDKYHLSPDTLIMFNGGNHTLYKRNVMQTQVNRWTRNMSLREAFARSVNTAFARLSFERMQPQDLHEYAIRFGFNTHIQTDLPFDPGFAEIPNEKNYRLAEIASGFNRITTMSPIQGAMIAASVADSGVMRVPYIIESAQNEKGEVVFQSEPTTAAITMSKEGAERLKDLMEETVTSGTGRKSFRQMVRSKKFEELKLGGKTGSLQGNNPKGKVDWFVGYAINEDQKIAIATITVNIEKWTVKSTHLAQSIFRKHFGNQFSKNNEKFLSASSTDN